MTRPARRRPSTVDRLDPEIKSMIGKLRIDHGWTIDEILARLRELGQADLSRSALGRHVKSIEEIGAQLRHSREVANALVAQLGDAPEDKTAELNLELMHGMILRLQTATNDDGDGQTVMFGPQDVSFLSGALKNLASARKTNADMVLRLREEVRKESAKKAVDAAKSKGLTGETVDFIRRAVLGTEAA